MSGTTIVVEIRADGNTTATGLPAGTTVEVHDFIAATSGSVDFLSQDNLPRDAHGEPYVLTRVSA